MEEWKDIDDNYAVSNYGNVKSKERTIFQSYNGKIREKVWKEKMLSKQLSQGIYARVKLYNKHVSLSHLVAKAFLENPNNYDVVHHKDHNPMNNNVENLEWKNKEEHDIMHSTEKSKNVYQYTLDGKLVKIWPSTIECGRNGFCQGHVASCCRGERKTHKGYIWSYSPMN